MAGFDLQTLLERVQAFTARVPQILRRSALTAALADEVARFMENSELPFTMAVVGQMRAGKSTLINALINEDLAITDVNETTATINWFKHGTSEQTRTFRVTWRSDLPQEPEVRDLSELKGWVGDSELARKTRYVELFSEAGFLKQVQVVDTPGTRSVIEGHEQTVREFLLADRHERETLYYGGVADCIVYVLNPVARKADAELLNSFESKTRIPGGSPYNSVAVVHKWESLEHDDPYEEAQRKADIISLQLRRYVAGVIPVSGPLGRAVSRLPHDYWDDFATFVGATTGAALQKMVSGMERQFTDRALEGSALDAAGRRCLYEKAGLPWPCFKAILKLATKYSCRDGATLRTVVREASGMDRLLAFLEQRFFDRSRVIRAFNLLSRALRPCEVAVQRLREHVEYLEGRRSRAAQAVRELEPFQKHVSCARNFLSECSAELGREMAVEEEVRQDLVDQLHVMRMDLEGFSSDLEAVRLMDDHPHVFPNDESVELLSILGAYGSALNQRLSFYPGDKATWDKVIEGRLSHWNVQKEIGTGVRKQVLQQVVVRLEEAADGLATL
jgi:hypothetical protein